MDCAIMPFKIFLRGAIESERGDRTVKVRDSHAPCAVGAAPATELVPVDPDQAFIHTSTFGVLLGFELGRGGRNT
jgi:hypothetical protein